MKKSKEWFWLAQDEELKEPSLCKVIIYNDDYTPMEFVILILEKFFYFDRQFATLRMFEAHTKGKTLCGIYTRDIALSKIKEANDYSRMQEHPLKCDMEYSS